MTKTLNTAEGVDLYIGSTKY